MRLHKFQMSDDLFEDLDSYLLPGDLEKLERYEQQRLAEAGNLANDRMRLHKPQAVGPKSYHVRLQLVHRGDGRPHHPESGTGSEITDLCQKAN